LHILIFYTLVNFSKYINMLLNHNHSVIDCIESFCNFK
jgi:hypothetical protein